MALFGFKKKDSAASETLEDVRVMKKEVKQKETSKVNAGSGGTHSIAHVLRNPRVTEKGTTTSEGNAYLFDVAPRATKPDIARAVALVYKVTPRMIRVVTVPAKKKRNARTGRVGIKTGGKKAYVYLRKGEAITLA